MGIIKCNLKPFIRLMLVKFGECWPTVTNLDGLICCTIAISQLQRPKALNYASAIYFYRTTHSCRRGNSEKEMFNWPRHSNCFCPSVLSVTLATCAKQAKWIELIHLADRTETSLKNNVNDTKRCAVYLR